MWDANVDHTQIIGGYSQIIGGDISPIPPGFRHPCMVELPIIRMILHTVVGYMYSIFFPFGKSDCYVQ